MLDDITLKVENEEFKDFLMGLVRYGLPEDWILDAEASLASYSGKSTDFIQDKYINEACGMLKLPDDALDAFLHASSIIREQSLLCRFVWHLHYVFFHSTLQIKAADINWEFLKPLMGTYAHMLPAVVLLSALPHLTELSSNRNIPMEVTLDTLSDVEIWMRDHKDKFGVWGFEQISWLLLHFRGDIFRLGRLQFAFEIFHGNVRVYRNIKTKKLIVLSENNVKYRRDGLIDGTDNVSDTDGAWTSILIESNNYIQGNPVSPFGYSNKDLVEICTDEWQLELSNGDQVLAVHIPVGGKMAHDLCRKSFEAAMEFFPKCFPERSFKGFTCSSWLMDAQFQNILPVSSNIVGFQREFHLFPILSDDSSTFYRVFGSIPDDIFTAPKDTPLRKAIIDYTLSGKHLHCAGGFILKDDLDWGGKVYQK